MMRRTSPIMLVVAAIGLMPLIYARSQKQSRLSNSNESCDDQTRSGECPNHHSAPGWYEVLVDLTQRGVVYEFDSKTSRIDFSKVMVRTAQGEVTIGSYLEKALRPGKLPSFTNSSLSLVLGNRATRTIRTPLTNGLNEIVCQGEILLTAGVRAKMTARLWWIRSAVGLSVSSFQIDPLIASVCPAPKAKKRCSEGICSQDNAS